MCAFYQQLCRVLEGIHTSKYVSELVVPIEKLIVACRVAGKQDVQDLQPPVQTAKRLFAREAQNGHADWYLLSQVAAESFAHCSEPPQHVLQQALDDSLALFQSALECAALLEVRLSFEMQ